MNEAIKKEAVRQFESYLELCDDTEMLDMKLKDIRRRFVGTALIEQEKSEFSKIMKLGNKTKSHFLIVKLEEPFSKEIFKNN